MVIRVEKLIFEPEEGNPAEFYVLEQTMLGGSVDPEGHFEAGRRRGGL